MGRRYTQEGILSRKAARRILRPYAKLLALVVHEAWVTWHHLGASAPDVRRKLGRSSRAFNISDFIKDEVIRRFQKVGGCSVVMEYGRPVIVLANGDLKLRLGKINPTALAQPQSDRQWTIWGQEDAVVPRLLDGPSGTWATCGYDLNDTETDLAGISIVCELEGRVAWTVPLRMPVTSVASRPTPITTTSVPPAKISSAQTSALGDTQATSGD